MRRMSVILGLLRILFQLPGYFAATGIHDLAHGLCICHDISARSPEGETRLGQQEADLFHIRGHVAHISEL